MSRTLVLLPFIGKGVNGARRWISFGIINFQPSDESIFATGNAYMVDGGMTI
jgi:cell division protein FtsW (lipid II flippase)